MIFKKIIEAQHNGERKGITSICSSHPWVIKASLCGEEMVFIEATCNQVNQFGGYTGLTPQNFISFVKEISQENRFPFENIVFGGDHLGPNPWKEDPEKIAMQKSATMVEGYVKAGFTKIHLDCSMNLADDQPGVLDPEISARRTAKLAKVAENSYIGKYQTLSYIIGSEVPIPGGAQAEDIQLQITLPHDVQNTIDVTKKAFKREGLEAAWDRVVAVVVQPGVEFGDDFIIRYDRELAKGLTSYIEEKSLVYEAHSTDYQSRKDLSNLVEDHFAILKVGPALSFAFREAIFTLAMIEDEIFPEESKSNLITIIDQVMVNDPKYWLNYYSGSDIELKLSRKYSLSDRIRYYWSNPLVQDSLRQLLKNIDSKPIPTSVSKQYGLRESNKFTSGKKYIKSQSIIVSRIREVLDNYRYACHQKEI